MMYFVLVILIALSIGSIVEHGFRDSIVTLFFYALILSVGFAVSTRIPDQEHEDIRSAIAVCSQQAHDKWTICMLDGSDTHPDKCDLRQQYERKACDCKHDHTGRIYTNKGELASCKAYENLQINMGL